MLNDAKVNFADAHLLPSKMRNGKPKFISKKKRNKDVLS